MKAKTIVTILLLALVAGSVVAVVIGTGRSDPVEAISDGVIVCYFHGNTRCPTCMKIEKQTQQAVEAGFAEQCKQGRLHRLVINYEQPGREQFAKEYQLEIPTVILVDKRGGQRVKWKNLDRVWELVEEKAQFMDYLQEEIRTYLAEAGKEPAPQE